MNSLRLACILGTLAAVRLSFASFHDMNITEVLTGANGNTAIQYVEMEMEGPGENFVSTHHLVSKNASGTVIGNYTVPTDVAAGFQRKILLGTQAFANLNVVTPDFILPANFLSPTAGQVSWVDGALPGGTVTWGAYTGTGATGTPISTNNNSDNFSLTRVTDTGNDNADFQSLDNTPRNNANVTGHISPTAAVSDWAAY